MRVQCVIPFYLPLLSFFKRAISVSWEATFPTLTEDPDFSLIFSWHILPHFLFLGLVAQTLGYILWNVTVEKIGPSRTVNLLYLSPLVTMTTAVLVLGERVTLVALAGCALILIGVALSDSGLRLKK